ncbi:maf-like protein [Roseobacter denitrificans]|uniref:Nucleoside triphosphate pyrophosphatase n=1 Tax=Roseobacter denitrificans (strain ATCC 33942 / OCh 114) TaxID=375451 RepID=NTPP_ROSDO|nr:Maf family protein [Roseobacter denitrificans]Q16CZ1.1 RecName: Full=Nucleoside triphosphate pyrophosphatase; AltName: Full=Nucleotide pyrophosphatase; Short=Nucleotide PPase [Roseobacter denitrificans OCh 114]ABG30152.1 septum formation protein, putative [Roseobacter denitrificans OCh 114]AVL53342.1 maf-like protein [Roseobacter denitrificans]SFF70076.1 septum formation protein [Roseobacter denitrificans OCh 114]
MPQPLILASTSEIRAKMLSNAGVPHTTSGARIDEEMVKEALLAEQASPRDIADTLAEMKARKISDKTPGAIVLGCDQVLDHRGVLLSKPVDSHDALTQLQALRNDRHTLLSAAVICEDGKPVWRHVGVVRLRMHDVSDAYLQDYVARNWDSIRHAVGAYKLEEEGVRLFSRIDGDYFTVLGLPLLELLSYLALRGDLPR